MVSTTISKIVYIGSNPIALVVINNIKKYRKNRIVKFRSIN